MTRKELLKSGLTLEQYVNQCVEELMAKPVADAVEGMQAETQRAERAERRIAFEQLATLQALRGGLLAKAAPYVVSDAAKVFELRDNSLVARHGETDPGDPCSPLSFAPWLKEVRKETPFLFTPSPSQQK